MHASCMAIIVWESPPSHKQIRYCPSFWLFSAFAALSLFFVKSNNLLGFHNLKGVSAQPVNPVVVHLCWHRGHAINQAEYQVVTVMCTV